MSLENVIADVNELEKNMEIVKKECESRGYGNAQHVMILRDFLNNSEDKLNRLKNETKTAQETFRDCVEYFGEPRRGTDANAFFSMLVRFVKAFKVKQIECLHNFIFVLKYVLIIVQFYSIHYTIHNKYYVFV